MLPWVAHAAGLGKLTILSALGRPLLAEIDLISVQEDALATLKVRIAPPEAFAKANVQYSPALIGVRLSIERRSDGRPYIKIITTRLVNEPFIDLLVELNWEQGHLVREYTALIDPPGYTPDVPIVQAAPPVEQAPAVALESQTPAPTAPVEAKPAAKAPVVRRPAAPARTLESQALPPIAPVEAKPAAKAPAVTRPAAPARAESKAYGPVKRGETLSKIAASVKPEGVTLEQMLVSLYRANRDAFGGNMNILYTGKILRIPEEQEVAATARSEATKELRVQAAGKETPMEVLKLSRGEFTDSGKTGNGKGASRRVTERLRALETEVDSLEKALTEANALVAQLEQTVKTMQRRIPVTEQLPGVSPAATLPQPAPGAKPGDAPPVKGGQVAPPEPAKAEPAKTEPAKVEPAGNAGQMSAEAPGSGKQAAPAAQPAAAGAGAPTQPKPKPAENVQAPPDMIDQILAEPLYLAGGGLLALLGGAGYWFARRRRRPQVAIVDPLAEANLFLSFGRDHQAEEILKELLEKDPANEEARLKLSQIHARRKDKTALDKIEPHNVDTQTAGAANSSLAAALGDMARALEARDVARDAGAAHAAAEAAPEVAAPDFPPKFPDGMRPPDAPDKTPDAPGGEAVKTGVTGDPAARLGEMARAVEIQNIAHNEDAAQAVAEAATAVAAPAITLDFPGGTQTPAVPDKTPDAVNSSPAAPLGEMTLAVETPAIAHNEDAAQAAAEVALEFAAPEITLNFPDGMQTPAAPDKTPGAPEGEAVKTGGTGNPAGPMIGTIDFETTAPAPATPDDGKDSTQDDAIIPESRKP